MSLLKVSAVSLAALALVAGVTKLAEGAPHYQPVVASQLLPAPASDDGPAPTASPVPAAPVPTSSATPLETAPDQLATLPVTSTGRWAINIDTTGYQTELDECLWVRMDLGAAAPIVGAHNNCGGSIVLDMKVGDTVTLMGTALDGTYTVIDSRNAHAGDAAATATAGWIAAVILQTCYWNSGGEERLLALQRA